MTIDKVHRDGQLGMIKQALLSADKSTPGFITSLDQALQKAHYLGRSEERREICEELRKYSAGLPSGPWFELLVNKVVEEG